MRQNLMWCALTVACTGAIPSAAEGGFAIRAVAVSGLPAPSAGADFGTIFICPVIDAQGHAAFYGTLDDEQTLGIFVEGDSALELLALEGSPAPGTDGAVFSTFASSSNPTNLGYDLAGNVYFKATLAGGDVVDCNANGYPENDLAFYTNRNGPLELLIREDDPGPDQPPGVTLDEIVTSGDVSPAGPFGGYFAMKSGACPSFGPADDVTLMDFGAGLMELVAPGNPGPLAGTEFAGPGLRLRFSPQDPMVMAFTVGIQGQAVNTTNDSVLAVFDHGTFRVKVRESDTAPGSGGLIFGPSFGTPKSSIRGDIYAWVADLLDDALQPAGKALYVSQADDTLRPVVFQGDPAPGLSPGVTFQTLGSTDGSSSPWPIGVDDDANVIFHAAVQGPGVTMANNGVLFRGGADGDLTLVAREDDPAPGLPDGVRLGSNGTFFVITFGTLAMNRHGNAAFVAQVYGPGFPLAEANALYFYDSQAAVLRKALATNDRIDVSGDGTDIRTVSRIEHFNYDHVLRRFNGTVLNEDDQFPVSVSFSDGSAAVLVVDFNADAVPGDIDGDGIVGVTDFLALLAAWGPCPGLPEPCPADLDGNGSVGVEDFLILLANFG